MVRKGRGQRHPQKKAFPSAQMFVPNDVSDFRSGGHQSSGRNCFLVSFANCFVLLFCLFCFWKTRLLRLSPRVISPYSRHETRQAVPSGVAPPGGPTDTAVYKTHAVCPRPEHLLFLGSKTATG